MFTRKRNFDHIESPDQPVGQTISSTNKSISRRIKLDHTTSLHRLCNVNSTLRKEQRKAVESMGFSSMLSLKVTRIDHALMVWLLKRFDPSTLILNINGKKINIITNTVKSALGIPCSGKKIPKDVDSNLGKTRYGVLFKRSNGESINLAKLKHKIQQSTEDGPTFKILYMMFLCATVLFPKGGTSLDLDILEYLVDVGEIHKYNWGELVLERLVEGVHKYNIGNRKVTGCILMLQVIFITELARTLRTSTKLIVSNQPYVEQWNQKEMFVILQMFTNLGGYLSPCTLNFESLKANKDSSKTKYVDDIFVSICKYMPKLNDDCNIIGKLLSPTLDQNELMVQYHYISLERNRLRTLSKGTWLNSEVLNCVAELTWHERKSCPHASRNWNLPTYFVVLAQDRKYDDNYINHVVFGREKSLYRGSPSKCSTISIPILHRQHFFLCKVDIKRKIIEICDTSRSKEYDQATMSMIKNAVIRLESVSKLWGDGSFKNSNWDTNFVYQYKTTHPVQPNSYDCGIYVCLLMMFPQGINRALTEEESVSTRMRLAIKLYTYKENRVYNRNLVTNIPDSARE